MSKILKDNKIINDAVNTEWYFLTKRADIPPLPLWLKFKFSSPSQDSKKIYGIGVPWACFWYNNEVEIYLHGDEFRSAIYHITDTLSSLKLTQKHVADVFSYCEKAREEASAFFDSDLKKISNKKLFDTYQTIARAYALAFLRGFFTWCAQVAQHNAKEIVTRYKVKIEKLGINTDTALGALIISGKPTLYKEKEMAMDKLSKIYQKNLANIKTEKYISKNFPSMHKAIINFLGKYRLIGYEYNGPALTYSDIVKEIRQRKVSHQKSISKKSIIKACSFIDKEREVFEVLGLVSHVKDMRNTTDDYIHFCLDNFYKEVARRSKMDKADVKFLWDEEVENLLIKGKRFGAAYINKKRKFCGAVSISQAINLKNYYLGKEARRLEKIVYDGSQQEKIISSNNILKGIVASTGKAIGKVRIVLTYKDVDKVKRGDILVAYTTSPKFMPAIIRCGAIVTNDGGLTSHAAIIARELKKPCVIGTKIATKVLHDGDLVEVDANSGTVKIIKKFL